MLKRIGACLLALVAAAAMTSGAAAQSGEPIKIGFGMALTGPLTANGKQALLGMKIWEEETNARAGCSGGRSSSSTMMINPTRRRCRASTRSSSTSTRSTS